MLSERRKTVLQLTLAALGVMGCLLGVFLFNQYVLMVLPLPVRMLMMILTQWLLFLVPGILMLTGKEHLKDMGFTGERIGRQIAVGCGLAFAMSAVLTVLPILAGFKDMIGSCGYTQAWQFIYEFIYSTAGVALAEELIFRGYFYQKLLKVKNNPLFAAVVSSVFFGFFHILNGNLLQVVITALMGMLFCLFRSRIKNCTLLSLVICHGVYDGLITLWCGLL